VLGGVAAAAAVAAGLWLLRPAGGAGDAPAADGAPAAAGPRSPGGAATLEVAPDGARRMGIRVAPAAAADMVPLISIPAAVEPPANARVAVAATVPGVVLTTRAVEGQMVVRGQTLAVVSSREVVAMAAERESARARLGIARARAQRLGQLSREGIIAGARADEAAAEAAQAAADLAAKSRILSDIGADGTTGRYRLRAPISGRVAVADIAAGRPLDGGTAPFVIDAADRYQAVGQLPQRFVDDVSPGLAVRTPDGVTGRVTAVGRVIDPATRSAVLKAELPAGSGLVAGAAIDLLVLRQAPADAVTVPEAAVSRIDGRPAVFVPVRGGYAVRFVDLGGTAGGQSVLLAGVRAGDPVVVEGASALKTMLRAE